MNKWRIYKAHLRSSWRAATMALRLVYAALFAFKGGSTYTVYDHGLLWRVLRDLWIVAATLTRAAVGILVLVTMPVLALAGFVLKLLLSPIYSAWYVHYLSRKVENAKRKFFFTGRAGRSDKPTAPPQSKP